MSEPQEPWQWPEARWRKTIDYVRAGRALRPAAWPGGARCAVALSFDSDHETNELRDGGKSIGRLSWGQYGARVGVPRIARLLERHGVPASFYVPAVAALTYPDEQRALVAAGHEIGIHGWIHELNSVLPYEAERDLMFRAAEALETITGVRPVGLRTPSWDFSPSTLKIEQELGLLYDSSLMADEDCYELLFEGKPTGIVEVPVEWVRDDAVYFWMHRHQSLQALHAAHRRVRHLPAGIRHGSCETAGCSSSPAIRTSSATARASGSSMSSSATPRARATFGSAPTRMWRAGSRTTPFDSLTWAAAAYSAASASGARRRPAQHRLAGGARLVEAAARRVIGRAGEALASRRASPRGRGRAASR